MKVSVAFDVKNYIEVMESWPITREDTTFFLEREDNLIKRVVIIFSSVGIEHAPQIILGKNTEHTSAINMYCGEYVELAIEKILNWQAVISGLQILILILTTMNLGLPLKV